MNYIIGEHKLNDLYLTITSSSGGVSKSMLTLNEAIIDVKKGSVHDKFHRALVLSGFFFLKIASTLLNSSFFPKPIKRRIAI